MKDRLPEDPDLIVPIDVVELGADRKVKFPVDLIRLLGDGGFCGGYTIFDKAGNPSMPGHRESVRQASSSR